MNYDLSDVWLHNCLSSFARGGQTPDRILSILSILDGEWNIKLVLSPSWLDEEYSNSAELLDMRCEIIDFVCLRKWK